MNDILAELHEKTYDAVASEYEDRVEVLRPTTEMALAVSLACKVLSWTGG